MFEDLIHAAVLDRLFGVEPFVPVAVALDLLLGLARICREDLIEPLAESAKSRLKELGYPNVFVKAGDGYFGWGQKAPFDVIIITAAAGLVPPPLLEQLKAGGRMILPLGSPYGLQTLVLIEKDDKGNITSRQLLPVRFVPMVGRVMK